MDEQAPVVVSNRVAHFEVLDGLRGVAAAAVLLGHAQAILLDGHTIVARKYLAVQFFFMLSGFVIAYAYEDRLRSGLSLKEFYLRRIIRLHPLILLGVLCGTIWFGISATSFISIRTPFAIVLGAAGLPSPFALFSFGRFPINPPQWSLFFELLAYAAFGALSPRTTTRWLAVFCAASFVGYGIHEALNFEHPTMPLFANIFGAAFSFSGGVLLWRLKHVLRPPAYQAPFILMSAILAGVCLMPVSLGFTFDLLAVALVFPALILFGAAREDGRNGRVERFLGDLSYPLYILHWPILLASQALLVPVLGRHGAVAAACLTAVSFSYLMLNVYDKPVRKWLTARLAQRRAREAGQALALGG